MAINLLHTTIEQQIEQAKKQHFAAIYADHPYYTAKQQAWKQFHELGLPHAKTETYKYTPFTSQLAEHFDLSQITQSSPNLVTASSYPLPDVDAYHLLVWNGQLLSKPSELPDHKLAYVATFTDAHQKQHPYFTRYSNHHDVAQSDAFAALNTTLFTAGLFIHIPEQAIVDKPIWIHHLTDATQTQGISYPRVLITTGKNSQASIISSWHSLGEYNSFTNAVTQIHAANDAQLAYYNLQTKDLAHAYQVNATHGYQGNNSILSHYNFTWDGAWIRNNPYFTIPSNHSETNLYGLYCLNGNQHVDNHTTVDHQQPHTQSNELYKGIMTDQATGVFNGRIYVRADAQKTHAFQANNNLLLSDEATIHTKPQLEIWADDVKCSHGATVGQLDENQLFYLQARGISHDMAQHMLLNAFASEVIDKVNLESLKQYLHASLRNQLDRVKAINA